MGRADNAPHRTAEISILVRIICGAIGLTVLVFSLVVGMYLFETGMSLDRLVRYGQIEALLVGAAILFTFPPLFLYAAIFGRFPEIWKPQRHEPVDLQSGTPAKPDSGRPTWRRRVISGLLMACVFGGAKWSQVPTADGVFWAVLAFGFALGCFGLWP